MSDHITRVREQAREFNEKLPGGSFADGAAWLASRLTREKLVAYLRTQNVLLGDMNKAVAEEQADAILALLTEEE